MPFFIHHVSNPYLYNPAFAGYDKQAVLFLTHREQWVGIQGAPSSSNLSFHTPAGYASPISLGGDISNDRIGILNHTTIRATFGYSVPLGVEYKHYLRFGLSGGISSQQFDLEDINIEDDLVLQNFIRRSTFLDGRFGIQYHLGNLNLGFALPHIFSNPMMNPDGFNVAQVSALDHFIASANYRINLNAQGNLAFEPTVLYNISRELDNQLEAFGVLQIKDVFWVGGGYQQQAGIAGMLGFKVKNMQIGYAYGVGGNALAGQSGGTHEAQVALFMGKKREVMKRTPRFSTINGDRIPEAAILAAKEEKKKKKGAVIPDRKKAFITADSTKLTNPNISQENSGVILIPSTENQQPTEKTTERSEEKLVKIPPSKVLDHPLALEEGKYIVVGTFSQEGNARKLIQKLSAGGYNASLVYHTEKKFYYVYVMSSSDVKILETRLQELKKSPLFENAWILSVEE